MSRDRPCRTWILAALLLLPAAGLLPGCSLAGIFYKHHYRAERFVIHTDHDPAFLESVGSRIEGIYRYFEQLYRVPARSLGRTTFFLRGDARDEAVVDLAYAPNLLGYYIPLLNMISVDTKPVWTRKGPLLDQILLHEIAHHFTLTRFPAARSKCWLNEGLSGNLEMTLFENGRFEHQLLNPILLCLARHAALQDRGSVDLKKLLAMGWNEFHRGERKDLNYALSWALVYYILEEVLPSALPLEERIRRLQDLDPDGLASLEPLFADFLRRFDLTAELIRLARSSGENPPGRLAPRWAVEQLGSLKFIDSSKALEALEALIDAPDAEIASRARLAFLGPLSQGPCAPSRISPAVQRGRRRIVEILLDEATPAPQVRSLAQAAAEIPRSDPWWIPVVIRLLESPDGEVRAEAARGLSKASLKPTIVNPSFWKEGDLAARTAEVSEWQAWWASCPLDKAFLD